MCYITMKIWNVNKKPAVGENFSNSACYNKKIGQSPPSCSSPPLWPSPPSVTKMLHPPPSWQNHFSLSPPFKKGGVRTVILHSYKCRICIMYKNFSTLLTLCNSKTFEKCLSRREWVWGIFYAELIKYWSIWIQRYLKGINFCGINLSRNWFSRICHFRKFCGITFCEFRNFWKFTKPFFVIAFCTISEIFGR